MERYQILEKFGEGTFNNEYKARDVVSRDIVLVKRMCSFTYGLFDDEIKKACMEIKFINNLKYSDRLIDIAYRGDKMFLIFEYLGVNNKNSYNSDEYDYYKWIKSF